MKKGQLTKSVRGSGSDVFRLGTKHVENLKMNITNCTQITG